MYAVISISTTIYQLQALQGVGLVEIFAGMAIAFTIQVVIGHKVIEDRLPKGEYEA